jgi:hypothetical protein
MVLKFLGRRNPERDEPAISWHPMNAKLQAVAVAPLTHPMLNADALKRSALAVIDIEAALTMPSCAPVS